MIGRIRNVPNNHKPLNGIKVIDLTTALSGPFCTMFFGDYAQRSSRSRPRTESSAALGAP